jgi:hypothetical protein
VASVVPSTRMGAAPGAVSSNDSPELVDVNGKVMTQWRRRVPVLSLVATVGLSSSSLVSPAFPPDEENYRPDGHQSR